MPRAQDAVQLPRVLGQLFRHKLASSGLYERRIIKALHLRPKRADEVVKLSSTFERRGAFIIPYFDPHGKLDPSFYRLRYLEPPVGFASSAEKARRYTQPPDTPPRAYLPPLLERPWSAIGADPTAGVIITEGELKAAIACYTGFPTIGLGGVYAFRSAKRELDLLPELEAFDWTQRRVTIIYDSDLVSNVQVARAMRKLADTLTDRGAQVFRSFIAPGAASEKRGLDDALAHLTKRQRVAELERLIAEAEPYARSNELWGLNDEVAYVVSANVIVNLETLQLIRPDVFVNSAYSDRLYTEVVETANGKTKLVERSLPKEWMRWPHRRKVNNIVYTPGRERLINDDVNVWPGWAVAPSPGDVSLWNALLDHLFKGEGASREWFERWLAIQFQQPGVKLYTGVVLVSIEQGTGKTFLAYILREIFGRNFSQISSSDLRSTFNSWAYAKQFILGEEISGGEDKRLDADLLKSIITQHQITVNQKYQAPFTVEDHANYIFTTNHPDAFYLEETDRRFFVHRITTGSLPRDLARKLDAWMRSPGGPAALFDHLLRVNLRGFTAEDPAPRTNAKIEMKRLARTDLENFAADLYERPDDVLRSFGPMYNRDLWTSEELLALRFPGSQRYNVSSMSRALTRAGVPKLANGGVVQTPIGGRHLYAVRNRARWLDAAPKQAGEHYVASLDGSGKKYATDA